MWSDRNAVKVCGIPRLPLACCLDGAFFNPVRKVYYNLAITGLSVFICFFIGTVEVLGLLPTELHLKGGFWTFMAGFNINVAGFKAGGANRDVIRGLGFVHFGVRSEQYLLLGLKPVVQVATRYAAPFFK